MAPPIEAETIMHIITAFDGEDMRLQYSVEPYRIDLYFPEYRLAVECDEKQHKHGGAQDDDQIREQSIKNNIGCTFIRFEPYQTGFNIFKVINRIHRHIAVFSASKSMMSDTFAVSS